MKKNLGALTLLFPTPVLVIGSYDAQGTPNAMTAAWGGICCSNPPCIQVSLQKARFSHSLILAKKAFTVNIPSEKQVAEVDFLGMASGWKVRKFEKVALTPKRGEQVDAPLILEFPVSMECQLLKVIELGSHDLFVGEVLAAWADEEILNDKGFPDPQKAKPLSFVPYDKSYYGIGPRVAWSFEVGKSLM